MKYFIIILSFLPITLFAQKTSKSRGDFFKNNALQVGYQNGHVFATNDFIRGANAEKDTINAFQAFSLEFSKQTTGENQWEQLYKYPNYGFGVYMADFHNPEEIGTPFAIYGFFNAPFKRWNKWSLNYNIGFGATFNWKAFNPISNQYNISIGAGESFFIDAGLNLQHNLTKRMDVSAGFSLTHFSNGALKKPNKGINTIGPKISLKYNFEDRPVFLKQEIPAFESQNEWLISVFGGIDNVIFESADIDVIEKYEGLNFPVVGISTVFNRQVSYKSKFGVGMSFSYNGALDAQVAVENNELESIDSPFTNKLQVSIFPSYELVMHKFSIILQPAFYVYRKKIDNPTPVFHQRIGLKYHFKNNLFVGITLRDYDFQTSDFIEWTLGYRFKKKR